MPLLPEDETYLSDRGIAHEVHDEGGMTCVVLLGWVLPPGFDHEKTDVLIRLAPGYPDVAPDMWWLDPPVRRADGAGIPAADSMESHLNRQWQRWSRHFNTGQWQPGIDRLENYVALMSGEFIRSAAGCAA